MGIKGLTKLLGDICPEVLEENDVKNYFGRKVAIDASMALYAFLVAVRPETSMWLQDASGETTSHIMGIWSRTLRLIRYGMKPAYVFDGKPPVLKSDEILKRQESKQKARADLEDAQKRGDMEEVKKLEKRTVRVTKQHNEEAKKVLRLMGIPVVEAPCEAEAQCAELCSGGKVFATGTEDMDALTLATPILLRNLNYSEAQKKPIREIHIHRVLEGLDMTMDQFIDMCILCGCDYAGTIRGVGPKRAYQYIKKYGSIEAVIESLDTTKYSIPENFNYKAIREYFKHPDVTPASELDLEWTDPDEEGLIQYLVVEKNFNEKRVKKGIAELKASRRSAVQGRLDGFFFSAPPKPKKKASTPPAAPPKVGPAPKPEPADEGAEDAFTSDADAARVGEESESSHPVARPPVKPRAVHPFFLKNSSATQKKKIQEHDVQLKQAAKAASPCKREPAEDHMLEGGELGTDMDVEMGGGNTAGKRKKSSASSTVDEKVEEVDDGERCAVVDKSVPKKKIRRIMMDDEDEEDLSD